MVSSGDGDQGHPDARVRIGGDEAVSLLGLGLIAPGGHASSSDG